MAGMIAYGEYDAVIASRIFGRGLCRRDAFYKYISNRFLTLVQNILLGYKLPEYHTGFRAFSRTVLESLPLEENSDDFVFDNEMLAQVIHFQFRLGEISSPTRYFAEASSINFSRSVRYGFGVLSTSIKFRLDRMGLFSSRTFRERPTVEAADYYTQIDSSEKETETLKRDRSSIYDPAKIRLPLGQQRLLMIVGLGLLVIAVYVQATDFDFINLDDNLYVYANPALQNGLNWETFTWAFTTFLVG